MTDLILKHRGTLDKYIGDAIMAIYNAPLKIEHNSILAIETALEMIEKLKEINNVSRQKGLPEIDIGIGINTGDVIVGNMGTDVRFDYTAIGDTVNLASRLEGLNKIYKTHIIVSEFTVKHLKGFRAPGPESRELNFRELDMIKVKGKDRPVTIYELSSGTDKTLIQRFEEALDLYKKQHFEDASNIFKCLVTEYNDGPSIVFLERCNEFMENPPDVNWGGVYTSKTK
jgi:adenylate cyclase